MAMTPRRRSSALSEASLTQAPRSLNELVTCRFSYLTKTSAPVSADSGGAGISGVRSTWPAMVRRAASMSASVTIAFSAFFALALAPAFPHLPGVLEMRVHHDRFWPVADRYFTRRQAACL